ncbi:hypothetical protein HMI54_011104 [Coelomomyces lativittatus]|nr:hypothetical protein HMI54_011104 [Coelomomyces lativittatus]
MTSSSSSTTATTSSSNTHGTYSSGTSSSSNQIYPRSTPSDLLSSSTTQASLFSSPTSPTKLTSSEIRSRKRTFPSSPTSTTPSSSSSSTNDTSSSSLPSSSSSSTTTSSSFKKLKSFLSPPPVSSSLPFTTPHPPPLSSKDLLFQFPSSSSSSTFSKYLQFMDKDQLISILLHLANSPVTQTVLSDHVPVPTVGFILQQLLHLEKKVVEALPYTRISALSLVGGASTTPTTSTTAPMYTDYALNRVRPILNEVQSTLLHFLDYFFQSMSLSLTTPKNPHHPGSMTVSLFNEWVRFLYESTCLVTRLPDFEPTTSTTSWSGKEGRGEWKYHPFTQTLLDTLKQYWQATFLGIQSQVVPPLRSEDLASIEKWYSWYLHFTLSIFFTLLYIYISINENTLSFL